MNKLFRHALKTRINCSIPIFDALAEAAKTDYRECPTQYEAKLMEKAYTELFYKFRERPESFGCPLPCTRISYDIDMSYYHENSGDPQLQKSNFSLFIYPNANFIEDQVE